MHMAHALLYFDVIISLLILAISIRVTSLALGQSYDCPSASEATLNDIGICWRTDDIATTKQNTTKLYVFYGTYRKVSNISRTKSQNLSVSRPVLPLSLPNLLKPCIKSIMKM